ncbi:XAC2610-related protein [Luteimonas aquatica]|uniref:XAC2610-related protein n=1 Tax=Luteimonas aquatica TaxID=450364 RepID=UPI001F5A8AFE|nr:hypothetical protein [Luteimonas aquatica]
MRIRSCAPLFLMLLALTACNEGNGAPQPPSSPEKPADAPAKAEPEAAPAAPATVSGGFESAKADFDANGQLQAAVGDVGIRITASECEPLMPTLVTCENGAEVHIDGPAGKPEQTFRLPSLYLNPQATVYRGKADGGYKKDGYSIIVSDLNGDGREDLAFWTGRQGAYGGPSFDIYLDAPDGKAFAPNRALSDLTVGHNGMFTVADGKIVATTKSGCCEHTSETYEIDHDKPKLVETVTERSASDGAPPTRTIERLIDGKMQKVQQ